MALSAHVDEAGVGAPYQARLPTSSTILRASVAARRSFLSTAIRVGQAAAREHAAARRRQAAADARAAREGAREQRQRSVEAKRGELLQFEWQVGQFNDALSARVDSLATLLLSGLNAAQPLDFDALKSEPSAPPFAAFIPPPAEPEPLIVSYLPRPLQGLHGFLPWARRAHAERRFWPGADSKAT
jgi:hypothetical protein